VASVSVRAALVVLTAMAPNGSGPPVTLAIAAGGAWNSTAPASTALFVFLKVPKKSVFGATLKFGVALDGM